MDVDQSLHEVGDIRRYHMFLFVTLGFSFMVPTAIDSMMLLFVGWTPRHHCRQFPTNITNTTEEFQEGLDSCTRTSYINTTGPVNKTEPCPYGWVYDGDPQKEWSIVSEWDLVCGEDHWSELAEILASTGSVLGLLIFSPLVDSFGRKRMYLISTLCFIGLTAGMAFTQHFLAYLSLRFINVVINEGVIAGGALLLIEMFSTDYRTFSGIGMEFIWTFGVLYLAMIYYLVRQWRHFLLVSSIPWAIFLSFIWILPESVPWLVASGRIEEAKKALRMMAKGNGVNWTPPETILLHSSSPGNKPSANESEKTNAADETDLQSLTYFRKFIILFKNKYTRKHFILSALLWFTNIWVYYGIVLSMPSLTANDKYLSFTISCLVEIPAYILCFIVVRWSRRLPVILFHIGAGVTLILGTVISVFDLGGKHQYALLMTFSMAAKFCVTSSYSIIILYIKELFPTSMRSTGAGLSKCIGRFGMTLAPSISLVAKKKPWIASLVLGVISVITGLASISLPETCNANLPNTMSDVRNLYKKSPKRIRQTNENGQINNSYCDT